MKLHLTLLTFILISINSVFSQNNNLQFNRALFEEYSMSFPPSSTNSSTADGTTFISNVTVPIGKVWKIESSNRFVRTNLGEIFNGFQTNVVQSNTAFWINNFCLSSETKYPIWLPAGTYTIYLNQSVGGTYQITSSLTISGIEFNLVP